MDTLEFLLDVPPSTNNLYREAIKKDGTRFRVKSGAYVRWQKHAWGQCHPGDRDCYKGQSRRPWQLYIVANINHTKDVSNLIKPIEDTLAEYLGLDDAYDNSICAERGVKTLEGGAVEAGKCKVYIYVLGE